jgi:hypothetical protein
VAREYVATMAANASTFTTTNPFFQLIAPATSGLTLFGFELTQEASTTSAVGGRPPLAPHGDERRPASAR